MSQAQRIRKPQVSIEVEADEKDLFQKAAKARRLTLSALARLLLLDEVKRLGVS